MFASGFGAHTPGEPLVRLSARCALRRSPAMHEELYSRTFIYTGHSTAPCGRQPPRSRARTQLFTLIDALVAVGLATEAISERVATAEPVLNKGLARVIALLGWGRKERGEGRGG